MLLNYLFYGCNLTKRVRKLLIFKLFLNVCCVTVFMYNLVVIHYFVFVILNENVNKSATLLVHNPPKIKYLAVLDKLISI